MTRRLSGPDLTKSTEAQQEEWLARWFAERGLRDYREMEPGPERDAHRRETFRLMYVPKVEQANIPEFPGGVE
jgi:hypothetical protein